MGRLAGLSAVIAMGLATAVVPAAATASAATVPLVDSGERPKHVVLVDWDGIDPDYLDRAALPHLDALTRAGSLTVAKGTYKTVSNPVRASMSTGAYPQTHGNVAHVYDAVVNRATGQSRFLAAQTIAESLAEHGRTVASVQWYMVENHGVRYGDPHHLYVQPGGRCAARVDAAVAILRGAAVDSGGQPVTVQAIPDLLAVYCSELDEIGHAKGPGATEIPATLIELDRQLGRLVDAVNNAGISDETAFLVTGDHGMRLWTSSLVPQVEDALTEAGYSPQVIYSGERPRPATDVVIVGAERVGTVSLRGPAATDTNRAHVADVLSRLPQISQVVDADRLRALHASPREGDMVAEAEPPWAFVRRSLPAGQVRGGHGSLEEIKVPLLLSGNAFCRRRPRDPELVDVAPTIAALLGVPAPAQSQGRVLGEVMRSRGCRADD
jgi:arylsulfatase A-like enzyme